MTEQPPAPDIPDPYQHPDLLAAFATHTHRTIDGYWQLDGPASRFLHDLWEAADQAAAEAARRRGMLAERRRVVVDLVEWRQTHRKRP